MADGDDETDAVMEMLAARSSGLASLSSRNDSTQKPAPATTAQSPLVRSQSLWGMSSLRTLSGGAGGGATMPSTASLLLGNTSAAAATTTSAKPVAAKAAVVVEEDDTDAVLEMLAARTNDMSSLSSKSASATTTTTATSRAAAADTGKKDAAPPPSAPPSVSTTPPPPESKTPPKASTVEDLAASDEDPFAVLERLAQRTAAAPPPAVGAISRSRSEAQPAPLKKQSSAGTLRSSSNNTTNSHSHAATRTRSSMPTLSEQQQPSNKDDSSEDEMLAMLRARTEAMTRAQPPPAATIIRSASMSKLDHRQSSDSFNVPSRGKQQTEPPQPKKKPFLKRQSSASSAQPVRAKSAPHQQQQQRRETVVRSQSSVEAGAGRIRRTQSMITRIQAKSPVSASRSFSPPPSSKPLSHMRVQVENKDEDAVEEYSESQRKQSPMTVTQSPLRQRRTHESVLQPRELVPTAWGPRLISGANKTRPNLLDLFPAEADVPDREHVLSTISQARQPVVYEDLGSTSWKSKPKRAPMTMGDESPDLVPSLQKLEVRMTQMILAMLTEDILTTHLHPADAENLKHKSYPVTSLSLTQAGNWHRSPIKAHAPTTAPIQRIPASPPLQTTTSYPASATPRRYEHVACSYDEGVPPHIASKEKRIQQPPVIDNHQWLLCGACDVVAGIKDKCVEEHCGRAQPELIQAIVEDTIRELLLDEGVRDVIRTKVAEEVAVQAKRVRVQFADWRKNPNSGKQQ